MRLALLLTGGPNECARSPAQRPVGRRRDHRASVVVVSTGTPRPAAASGN